MSINTLMWFIFFLLPPSSFSFYFFHLFLFQYFIISTFFVATSCCLCHHYFRSSSSTPPSLPFPSSPFLSLTFYFFFFLLFMLLHCHYTTIALSSRHQYAFTTLLSCLWHLFLSPPPSLSLASLLSSFFSPSSLIFSTSNLTYYIYLVIFGQ